MEKIIALLDLDYFYAQCEELRNPSILEKPIVIVMPSIRENSGVVATSNYLARQKKIRSGMPLSLAKKLASEDTIFINADKKYYFEVSKKVFEVIDFYVEKVEQVSVDEAYLDLTSPEGFEKAKQKIEKIIAAIKLELGLTCSVGLSSTKFIAKMASSINKPNGLTIILPKEVEKFLKKQRVSKLPGVGPKTEKKLVQKHILFVNDLLSHSVEEFIPIFGNVKAKKLIDFSKGVDEREIIPNREKKQLSRILTLEKDTNSFDKISKKVSFIVPIVFNESKKTGKGFKAASIILVNSTFETITRSKTQVEEITSDSELEKICLNLLQSYLLESNSYIRRIGVRVSNFDEGLGVQKKLFDYK